MNTKGPERDRKTNKVDNISMGKKVAKVVDVEATAEEPVAREVNPKPGEVVTLLVEETSKANQVQNDNVENNAIENFVYRPSTDEEGNSESDYVDSTQMVDSVPETQLDEAHKKTNHKVS